MLLVDADYLIEHLFWQHLDVIPDRDAARDLAAKIYPDPVQVLRLGEHEVERLAPILDELVSRNAIRPGTSVSVCFSSLCWTRLRRMPGKLRSGSVC
ncbi:hypothetical protein [Microbacterium sp.]|uniref:hypothetical protein n=1 Tax=Microbacterium sp. TaxID=51671 RepID=UPI0039E6DC9C